MVISIGLLLCVLIDDEKLSTVLVSIGAGGFASSILGIFIEKSNSRKIKYLRQTNLEVILHYYLQTIAKFLSCSFQIIINIFEKVPSNATYKITITEFIEVIKNYFPKFDQTKYFLTTGEQIYINKSQEYALTIFNVFNHSLKYLTDEIQKLISQDIVGLLKLYDESEIRFISCLYENLIEPNHSLEEYYYFFADQLLNEKFSKILGVNNAHEFTFYYANKKYALYDDKNLLNKSWISPSNITDAISFTETLSNKKDEA